MWKVHEKRLFVNDQLPFVSNFLGLIGLSWYVTTAFSRLENLTNLFENSEGLNITVSLLRHPEEVSLLLSENPNLTYIFIFLKGSRTHDWNYQHATVKPSRTNHYDLPVKTLPRASPRPPPPPPTATHCLKNSQNVSIEFSTNFCDTVWPKLQVFTKLAKSTN